MTTNRPDFALAADLVEAFAIVNDAADALSQSDARAVARVLIDGEEGSPPVSRARLDSAYRSGMVTNVAFYLPEDVSIRNLATVLGCPLIRARAIMAGLAVLDESEFAMLDKAYGITRADLNVQEF